MFIFDRSKKYTTPWKIESFLDFSGNLHSAALIVLPRLNPKLAAEVELSLPRWVQLLAAWISVIAMGTHA